MNEVKSSENVLIFSCPEAVLGSPEVSLAIRQTVTRARRALKCALVRAAALIARAWRYLKDQDAKAAVIKNELAAAIEEQHRKNPYYVPGVRGLL